MADGDRRRDPQKKEFKLQVSIQSLLSELREFCKRWGGKTVRVREVGRHQEKKVP